MIEIPLALTASAMVETKITDSGRDTGLCQGYLLCGTGCTEKSVRTYYNRRSGIFR